MANLEQQKFFLRKEFDLEQQKFSDRKEFDLEELLISASQICEHESMDEESYAIGIAILELRKLNVL